MYALIMAGGSGTRLWPRSRTSKPKQFLPLLGQHTMLQETVNRIAPMVTGDHTLVITGRPYVELTAEQLPGVPLANIVGEPTGKGSAPAIGLGALAIERDDPAGVMVVLSSDHMIRQVAAFRAALEAAEQLARDGWLVTLGITPTEAHTGYGYVHRRDSLGSYNGFEAYAVERFVEKPDYATAEEYVRTGEYSWNAGIFIWRADMFMSSVERYLPRLYTQLRAIGEAGGPQDPAGFAAAWDDIEPVTVDYGIMERADRVAVIPVDIGWSDVGDWDTLAGISLDGADGHPHHLAIDTNNTLVFSESDRLIATIGLDSFLIVDTGDAIMIAPRSRAQDVKQLVDELRRRGRTDVL